MFATRRCKNAKNETKEYQARWLPGTNAIFISTIKFDYKIFLSSMRVRSLVLLHSERRTREPNGANRNQFGKRVRQQ